MTKAELVKKIAEKAEFTNAEAKKALDATVDALKDALAAGEKVQLVGFGTFAVAERPAREGINPATREKYDNKGALRSVHLYFLVAVAGTTFFNTFYFPIAEKRCNFASYEKVEEYCPPVVLIDLPSHHQCTKQSDRPYQSRG